MKIIVVMLTVALFAAMCASRAIEPHCRCLRTDQQVAFENIDTMKVIPPKPYCPRKEVILTLKNGRMVCIDPESQCFNDLVAWIRQLQSSKKTSLRNGGPTRQAQLFSTSTATLQTTATVTPATGRQ